MADGKQFAFDLVEFEGRHVGSAPGRLLTKGPAIFAAGNRSTGEPAERATARLGNLIAADFAH